MFEALQKEVERSYAELSKSSLFYTSLDRDVVWDRYISGFDEETRQEYNCNACKSFLRQFGGIVTVKDNKKVSLWDLVLAPEEYAESVQNLRNYISSLLITDIFVNSFKVCGTAKNLDSKRNIWWKHFNIELKNQHVCSNPDTVKAAARDNKNVLKRGLDELTLEATETVLDLIKEGSLYRGNEFKGILTEFHKIQKEYKKIQEPDKDNFCWSKSSEASAVSRIRNISIGTLLIDLSNGVELEEAVRKFERVVAPSNYKRPTALVTPKMLEKAKNDLASLGLLDSLQRRHANEADLSVNNLIYKYRPLASVGDVFDEAAKNSLVARKSIASSAESISIEEFIQNIVPNVTNISVLLESKHAQNMASLITSQDTEAASLFYWGNNFSWSYSGNVADSMKERVKAAGGKVDGVLRFSIQWNDNGDNDIDFDAHCIEPNRNEICFSNCKKPGFSALGGQLDVDIVRPGNDVAVENITWSSKANMKKGKYQFYVHNFSSRLSNGGFTAEIEADGQIYEFSYGKNLRGKEKIAVADVELKADGTFSVTSLINAKTALVSSDKWNIGTNKLHTVTHLLLSPNHWVGTNRTGNKHFMFILEGCKSDESLRPFFNEFLKPELNDHRKALELVAGKLKIEPSENQLSGLGFSDTKRDELIVQVTGKEQKFKRTFKINF